MAKKQSAADVVYTELKRRIVHCEYDSDVFLNEQALAQEFGVSRTPVREALHRLEETRIVTLSKAGAQIRPFDMLWVRDTYEIHHVMDTAIAVFACERSSPAQRQKLLEMVESPPPDDASAIEYVQWDSSVQAYIRELTRNPLFEYLEESLCDVLTRLWVFALQSGFNARGKMYQTLRDEAIAIAQGDKVQASYWAGKHTDVCITFMTLTDIVAPDQVASAAQEALSQAQEH